MKYLGKNQGFGQSFQPPRPYRFLEHLLPLCGEYERSGVSIAQIREDIKRYKMNENAERPNDPLFDESVRRALRAFALPDRVKMCHLNDVFSKDLPIWSSSPGLPWMQIGYHSKRDIQKDPDAIKRVRWFWCRVKKSENIQFPDCCAFTRTHIVKRGETKVSVVWGYPATISFGEAVFALPLNAAYRRGDYPIAYGLETGVDGCKKLYETMNGNHFLGVDFESFDKTLPVYLINVAFGIFASNIDFVHYEGYGVARVQSTLHMFDQIRDYFINTKIRICNGERYQKASGLASGSYFTQLVGSIANYVLLTYACLKHGVEIEKLYVFGGESLLALKSRMEPDDVARYLSPLGMVVDVEKSGSSRNLYDLSFLGYQLTDGMPTRNREKTFASLVYPERKDLTLDYTASRELGIGYANFGIDPLVDFWTHRIVNLAPLNLELSRDQRRFLAMLGVRK